MLSVAIEKEELDAHLAYLAEGIRMAIMRVEGRCMPGRVELSAANGELFFHPQTAWPHELPAGAGVLLEYEGHQVDYSFGTVLLASPPDGRFKLALPMRIKRKPARLVHRYMARRQRVFRLRMRGPWTERESLTSFELTDISTDGLGFIFLPSTTPIEVGQQLGGELDLPGECNLELQLVVRNTRPLFPGAGVRIAGARFLDIVLLDRLILAAALRTWAMGEPGRETVRH